jgi:hypothetical protein
MMLLAAFYLGKLFHEVIVADYFRLSTIVSWILLLLKDLIGGLLLLITIG